QGQAKFVAGAAIGVAESAVNFGYHGAGVVDAAIAGDSERAGDHAARMPQSSELRWLLWRSLREPRVVGRSQERQRAPRRQLRAEPQRSRRQREQPPRSRT